MDEPTAALSGVEVERLFAVARSLRDEGRALVFISHRFDEVFDLCDTVTVMRDGAYVATRRIAESSVDQIVSSWSAARSATCTRRPPATVGDVVLEVEGSTSPGSSATSPSGAGRRDRRPGRPGRRRPQRDRSRRLRRRRVRRRLGPPPRQGRPGARPAGRDPGRAWPWSPRTGASRAWWWRARSTRNVAGVIRARSRPRPGCSPPATENKAAGPWASRLEVKTSALDMAATTMSGGNQQKVVIAKWLATVPSC